MATIWIIILIAPIALWVVVRTKASDLDVKDNTKEEQEYEEQEYEEQEYNDWGFIDYFEKDDKK